MADVICEAFDVDGVIDRVTINEPWELTDERTHQIKKGVYSAISFVPEKRGSFSKPSNIKVKSESLIAQLDKLEIGKHARFTCSLVTGTRGLELHLVKVGLLR